MAGKGGGAWKVAYADFVTAMMAFFLVMWIVAQDKPTKQAIAEYFRNPSGTSVLPGKSSSLIPMKDGGPSPLDKSPFNSARGRLSAQPGPEDDTEGGRVTAKTHRIDFESEENSTLGMQVLFPDDAATLDDSARHVLDQMVPALLGKINKIEIRGHSSGRPLPPGSAFKNAWELSYARSMAAMQYLVESGIDARRIRLSQGGINDPNLRVDPAERAVKNSRVELYVLNEVMATPWEADQKRIDRKKKAGAGRKTAPGKRVGIPIPGKPGDPPLPGRPPVAAPFPGTAGVPFPGAPAIAHQEGG